MWKKSNYIILFLIISLAVLAEGDKKTKKDTNKTKVDTVKIDSVKAKQVVIEYKMEQQQQMIEELVEKKKKSKSEGNN